MKKFLEEFKSFSMKGNILDLAIGVIIGGAFSKIVSSLVEDIIMPIISLIIGKINIAEAGIKLTEDIKGNPVILKYGTFAKNIIDFLIISMSIFIFVRILNRFKRKDEEKKEELRSTEAKLLEEIRDILKKDIEEKS
ncbi:MAG: large-conductance mechanosensitive channel protein MscL [Clostridiaceae bacterium]|nr:large-conductance mechanosensitive channel protein MscL [Clostridiaceae bacterium]